MTAPLAWKRPAKRAPVDLVLTARSAVEELVELGEQVQAAEALGDGDVQGWQEWAKETEHEALRVARTARAAGREADRLANEARAEWSRNP